MTDQKRIEERVARLLEAQQDKHKIKALQAENERLRAAAAQAIEVLERVPGAYQKREELDSLWYDARLAIALLRDIVEKGTE